MAGRRPRLPMILGLAVLTVAAHLLMAAAHLVLHPVEDWPFLFLLAVAPMFGAMLMLRGRPRHGAIVVTLTMLVGAFWTLWSHFVAIGHEPATRFEAGLVQMLLAFQLQGLAAGVTLVVKPQVPLPRQPETTSP